MLHGQRNRGCRITSEHDAPTRVPSVFTLEHNSIVGSPPVVPRGSRDWGWQERATRRCVSQSESSVRTDSQVRGVDTHLEVGRCTVGLRHALSGVDGAHLVRTARALACFCRQSRLREHSRRSDPSSR